MRVSALKVDSRDAVDRDAPTLAECARFHHFQLPAPVAVARQLSGRDARSSPCLRRVSTTPIISDSTTRRTCRSTRRSSTARADVSPSVAFPVVPDPSRFPVDNMPVLRNGCVSRVLLIGRTRLSLTVSFPNGMSHDSTWDFSSATCNHV